MVRRWHAIRSLFAPMGRAACAHRE
jgi:hypothetical protein